MNWDENILREKCVNHEHVKNFVNLGPGLGDTALVYDAWCLLDNMKMILVSGVGNRGGQYHLGIGVSGVSDGTHRPN